MALVFTLDAQGAFIVGDSATGATAYSYPTSPNAERAKRNPDAVAAHVAETINHYEYAGWVIPENIRHYHRTNWQRLLNIPQGAQ